MTSHQSTDAFDAARDFMRHEGRLLEQRLFATMFEGAPADGVTAAVGAFRNADGGYGHGLEPDKLCPDSLPIDVEMALRTLDAVGTVDHAMLCDACDYLASLSHDGAVPLASAIIESYPRAEHWSDWTYQPGINPTAGLAGLLHKFGFDHPWLDDATAYCWQALEETLPDEAHAMGEALVFLEHVPDRERTASIADGVRDHLPKVTMRFDAWDPGYGVTPLHYAPEPASMWRSLFSEETIDAHLDRLASDQQPDGGWPLTWEPPSQTATLAYRGIETLRALRVLAAYGRITVGST
jgi:hypothetical protein